MIMRASTVHPNNFLPARVRAAFVAWALLMLLAVFSWLPRDVAAQPTQGPGGPILVVTSPQSTYGTYYAEILRTEGLNAFTVADIGTVSATTLANYDVVILAPAVLSAAQVTMFDDMGYRRRQPDRDGARCPAGGPVGPDAHGRNALQRLSAGRHLAKPRATASSARRCSSTAPPTATR